MATAVASERIRAVASLASRRVLGTVRRLRFVARCQPLGGVFPMASLSTLPAGVRGISSHSSIMRGTW